MRAASRTVMIPLHNFSTSVELTDGVLCVRAMDRRWLLEIERAREAVLQKMQHLLGRDQVARIVTRT
jgi:hypothetical protein